MELTKEYINSAKSQGEEAVKQLVYSVISDNSKIKYILQHLGRLPEHFKGKWLFDLVNHENHNIRLSAIKNIGKLKLNGEIQLLYSLLKTEHKTEVRREIVSSIGRQRNTSAQCFLIKALYDDDPTIVCQAIRSLLFFKDDLNITKELKKLRNHKNEEIQALIEKEFYQTTKKFPTLSHTETYDFLKNTIVHGDVQDILKSVPEESIHLTFTSPPYYNAREYSIYPSYKDYLFFLDNVFKEIHRVTKEGRFLLINTSPIIIPRVSRQHSSKRYPIPFDLHRFIVDMGWEYIDDIVWLKPEVTVKNRVGGFQQHRKPLGYKPNTVTEMIMVYRKKSSKLLDWNIRQYPKEIVENSKVKGNFETSNVWEIDPVYNKKHSAVFPVKLCKKVISYYSFEGDLVFDPFGGSGTLGKAAKALNRRFFLTELNDDYYEHMKTTKRKRTLYNDPETTFLEYHEFKKIADDLNPTSH